ncbi:MAG: hypothetical protein IKJ36_00655 [Clostridia bacterium]|nr:hypothetical protein [Clostridia bacterium]
MKKIIKLLLILIFTIFILYFGYQEYLQFKYPLYEISNLIRHATLPDSFYIHIESNSDSYKFIKDIYLKDGIINDYQKEYNQIDPNFNVDRLIITENNINYTIDNFTKSIITVTEKENIPIEYYKSYYLYLSGTEQFFREIENHLQNENYGNYKYLGKTTINNKKCHKFSFTNFEETVTTKRIFYLDTQTSLINQIDYYSSNIRANWYRYI